MKIPRLSLTLTRERYKQRCARCGGPGQHTHHRRGRSVVDKHTHCPCNLVLLCRDCHDWVHANPYISRIQGFIVERSQADPSTVIIITPWGTRRHDCQGFSH